MIKNLSENYNYFMDHLDEIVQGHIGESVLIYDGNIIGYFSSDLAGYREGMKRYSPGSFLLGKCLPKKEDYVQHFHSGVTFV